jgi:hypothetical protein
MRLKAALSLVLLAVLALSCASLPRQDFPGNHADPFAREND